MTTQASRGAVLMQRVVAQTAEPADDERLRVVVVVPVESLRLPALLAGVRLHQHSTPDGLQDFLMRGRSFRMSRLVRLRVAAGVPRIAVLVGWVQFADPGALRARARAVDAAAGLIHALEQDGEVFAARRALSLHCAMRHFPVIIPA